ncbi:hypothetical protein [Streptomyces sp. SID13031]|uniref:hypothetical protein n=1 Tax=Streptomyces sp. SID13031 TaxID=2706046 RepID=UPI0013C7F876|nr:hypothetical protein [Streptomyces sp. SID13031]NEA32674.1 hypothetical protein [Streptomyces sp. SID13031]
MAYSFAWRAVCGVIGGLGIALGLIVLPLDLLIPFVLLTIVVGLTAAVGHTTNTTGDQQERRTRGQAGLLAALPFLGLLALAGLALALGTVVLLLVLTLVITSPPAVRWYGDSHRGELDESVTSTAQLCRQWHDTFEDLHQATTPAARLRIVTARQRCLDELERRDPDGLNAWLSSTASAAGDPSRFLRMHQSEAPPTDS